MIITTTPTNKEGWNKILYPSLEIQYFRQGKWWKQSNLKEKVKK